MPQGRPKAMAQYLYFVTLQALRSMLCPGDICSCKTEGLEVNSLLVNLQCPPYFHGFARVSLVGGRSWKPPMKSDQLSGLDSTAQDSESKIWLAIENMEASKENSHLYRFEGWL